MSAARGTQAPAFDEWGCSPQAPLPVRLGAAAIAGYLRLAYAAGRAEVIEPGFHAQALASPGGSYIGVCWHRTMGLTGFFYPRSLPSACLVSRSRDGELLARIVVRLGSRAVRGSSSALGGRSKGGAAALRGLVRAIEAGFHIVVTPDGPKGPPERLKMGVVTLGALAGRPIVPLGVAVSRFLRLPSWDGTIIPLPFARFVLSYGEPLAVPPGRGEEALEA
ncbi:MAG: lysophospholipid acyltransferase family protein, partial [Nitrospinota bacterium]